MALYATKKSFSEVAVFGDYVQKTERTPLWAIFYKGKKADSHSKEAVQTA